MRLARAILAGASLSCALGAHAGRFFTDACRSLKPSLAKVTLHETPVVYSQKYSVAELTRMTGSGAGRPTMGLTLSEKSGNVLGGGRGVRRASRNFECRTFEIDIHLHLTDHRVFIARDFPRGSCLFDLVLEHENIHVGININMMRKAAAALERHVNEQLTGVKAWGSPADNIAWIQDFTRTKVLPAMEAHLNEIDRTHTHFDRPEITNLRPDACDGALRQVGQPVE